MNYMEEVAKMLGVELGEIFNLSEYPNKNYKLDKELGFLFEDGPDSWWTGSLDLLLTGKTTIKRKPWKPKFDNLYWTVNGTGEILSYRWGGDIMDFYAYKLGNCYRTREEAETNRDKWVQFYASDEVLEV